MVEHGVPLELARAIPVMPLGSNRLDAEPEDGSPPGSSYAMLRDQCLDAWGVARCLLTFNVAEFGAHLNPTVSTDLCTAANDWNIDQWLDLDDRLYSGIVVSGLLPDEASDEVKRLADHPRMSCVVMGGSPLSRAFGDPLYHPIYLAAAEAGLPIVIHVGAATLQSVKAVTGPASTVSEVVAQTCMAAGQHISSFIVHGVFEKFPNLKLVVNEFGLSWLPSLIWNLDREYPLLRLESPWVRRAPSEYIHDHVRLSTQPLEVSSSDGRALTDLLSTIDGVEDLICFSSDYPHYTMDDFAFAARVMPDAWHDKVFFENACEVFGWHDVAVESPATAAAEA
jgi:predicted TIM-barrel fold metal-dependent hydrolase